MRILVFILSLIGMPQAQAGSGSIQADLDKHHDIVAIVKIDSINTEYSKAVNIVIDRVIYQYSEDSTSKSVVNVEAGDRLVLVESKVSPVLKENEGELPRTKKVESVRSTSCYRFRDYKVGLRLRLFAKKIQKGFYRNSACTLTRVVNEDT